VKVAYFDCEFGAAGDMLVGSLLSAGASLEHIIEELNKLNLPATSFELSREKVVRCSILCTKFNVLIGPDKDYEDGLYPSSSGTSKSTNSATEPGVTLSEKKRDIVKWSRISTSQGAGANQDSVNKTAIANPAAVANPAAIANPAAVTACPCTLNGIIELFRNSSLSAEVATMSSKIFDIYFRSEATCQGFDVHDLQMNELMALDAIVDIVAFSVAYRELGIEQSFVSPVPLGAGTFPYGEIFYSSSAPATVQVLKEANAPISPNKFHNECLTVTGAAILCTIASGWSMPAMSQLTDTGYGAGSYDPATYPNACRVILGNSPDAVTDKFKSETIVVMEANIDDLSPQSLAYAMERLFEVGALDVLVLPAVMKKGRSGHLLKVLCSHENQVKLQEVMFAETSTIGVRFYDARRVIAAREWRRVVLDDGAVIRVKVALDQSGAIVHSQPEYDDCAAYAHDHNIPLKSLIAMVMTRFANAESVRNS
jgi:uncharacterized protein (TIGR00299 family) protein